MGRNCLIGCLAMTLAIVIACGLAGFWTYYYLPGIIIAQVRDGVVKGINDSELAPEDKQEIIAQIDRVLDAYANGEINRDDLLRVMEEVGQSPVMGSFMVYALEEKYIKPSTLPEEEKTAAKRTFERIMRGIVEKKIKPDDLDISDVSTTDAKGQKQLKDKITDEDLRALLVKLNEHADDADIPDEPYEVRIGAEMRKAVDKALLKELPAEAEGP